MNYLELKSDFADAIKRRDMSATQVDKFLQHALRRCQRLLRVPAMEATATVTISAEHVTGGIPIPDDFLRLLSITTPTAALQMRELGAVLAAAQYPGIPAIYARRGAFWLLGPKPDIGLVLGVNYYVELDALSADTDDNWIINIAPDVVLDAACSRACKHFLDRRQGEFEKSFLTGIAELQEQAVTDELLNAAVSPAYTYPED